MEKLLNDLNALLCDLNVFYRKLQNYHWNIKGKFFLVIHGKLEEYYDEINEQVDEIAEHILALGGQPLGTLKDYLQFTKIAEAENKKVRNAPQSSYYRRHNGPKASAQWKFFLYLLPDILYTPYTLPWKAPAAYIKYCFLLLLRF